MYQWKKTSEKPHNQTCSNGTPGKIEFKLPTENGDLSEQRHGAKYTEAEVQQLLMGMIKKKLICTNIHVLISRKKSVNLFFCTLFYFVYKNVFYYGFFTF